MPRRKLRASPSISRKKSGTARVSSELSRENGVGKQSCRPPSLGRQSKLELESGGEYQISLKNGSRHDLRIAQAIWEALAPLITTHPDLFAAALNLANGIAPSPAMSRELRREFMTLENGELRAIIRDVLLSSYQETADGPILISPFKVESPADRQAFEECEKRAARNTTRMVTNKDIFRDDHQGRE